MVIGFIAINCGHTTFAAGTRPLIVGPTTRFHLQMISMVCVNTALDKELLILLETISIVIRTYQRGGEDARPEGVMRACSGARTINCKPRTILD